MSILPENELDLEKLFLPAWAQEPPSAKPYGRYEGGEERPERKPGRRGPKPPRRDGGPGERPRENRSREGRPRDDRRGPRREGGGKPFNRDRERPSFRREEFRER